MIDSIILGVIQGITEFLPISSSGHLIFAHDFIKIPQDIVLDVMLHLATLLAIVTFYHTKIRVLIVSFFYVLKKSKDKEDIQNTKLIGYLILATIPAVIVGYTFQDFFESIRSETVVAVTLFTGGVIMLFDVALSQNKNKFKNLTVSKSLIIGVSQVLAFVPGTSRSGATIVTGSLLGLKKKDAADFSFLLAIPAIAGAFLLQVIKVSSLNYFLNLNLWVAFFTAFFVGLISIKFLLSILNKWGFLPFAIYRIALAFLILILFV